MLFFIPSWGDLLGCPILGTYANQNVLKILSDPVIFLGGFECSFNTEEGYLHYLFGLKYYFLKFELKSGRDITDNRHLTGLILSDFVYDHLATSKNITIENYEMRAIGKAFEISRDNMRKIFLLWDNIWKLSKLANIYQCKEEKLGLSYKEKNELLEKIDGWIAITPKNLIKLGPKNI